MMLEERDRTVDGRFIRKAEEIREVRTLRATKSTWEALGAIARLENCSRADILEVLVENYYAILPVGEGRSDEGLTNLESAVELLEEGLDLKPNAGGAIKEKIRKALVLLKV